MSEPVTPAAAPDGPPPDKKPPEQPSDVPSEKLSEKKSRAGRNLPVAIASGLGLGAIIIASLVFYKSLFIVVVVAAANIAIWELGRGFRAKGINLPQEPLMVGGTVMILAAYFEGTEPLVTATAVTGLVTMLWLLRRGIDGFVRDATASVFTAFYVPFLGSFVALLLAEDDGVKAIITFIVVTIASDIGGYAAGVLFGKHPMSPVISPKKTWEGFAGSTIACVLAGWLTVVYLLDGDWWVGVALGVIAVVMATLGDLVESVIKRDLGIKDMSHVIPGHGGLMDRLDSLLATCAPIWLLLHYAVL